MISSNQFKKGVKVLIDGNPFIIVQADFVKPGKGSAFTRTKFKSLLDGRVVEYNVRSGDGYPAADITDTDMQYLYQDGDSYVFMDTSSYEQMSLTADAIGDGVNYLFENCEVKVLLWNGRPISVELPNFVELEITYCEPGVKGNTATGATKPATLSTGAVVQVPLFIEQNQWIRVDTRSNSYMERVKR